MTHTEGLFRGRVMHRRLRPKRHRLAYRLAMVLLDLDALPALDRRLRLFSVGRFNLFSFDQRAHGDGSQTPLAVQVARRLAEAGIAIDGLQVSLLTMPRLFGFAFNPISLYCCWNRTGRLCAVLYEVNNTFGERHTYLFELPDGAGEPREHGCAKAMHVSPFNPMDLHYRFRLALRGERLGLAISTDDAAGTVLSAVLDLKREALTDAALLRTFAAMPLMTLKVVAGIGWEALKLWAKRVPVYHKPAPAERAVTVVRA